MLVESFGCSFGEAVHGGLEEHGGVLVGGEVLLGVEVDGGGEYAYVVAWGGDEGAYVVAEAEAVAVGTRVLLAEHGKADGATDGLMASAGAGCCLKKDDVVSVGVGWKYVYGCSYGEVGLEAKEKVGGFVSELCCLRCGRRGVPRVVEVYPVDVGDEFVGAVVDACHGGWRGGRRG